MQFAEPEAEVGRTLAAARTGRTHLSKRSLPYHSEVGIQTTRSGHGHSSGSAHASQTRGVETGGHSRKSIRLRATASRAGPGSIDCVAASHARAAYAARVAAASRLLASAHRACSRRRPPAVRRRRSAQAAALRRPSGAVPSGSLRPGGAGTSSSAAVCASSSRSTCDRRAKARVRGRREVREAPTCEGGEGGSGKAGAQGRARRGQS